MSYENFLELLPLDSPVEFPVSLILCLQCLGRAHKSALQHDKISFPLYLEPQWLFATAGLFASLTTKTTSVCLVSFAKHWLTLCFWELWCWHFAGCQEAASGWWSVGNPCGQAGGWKNVQFSIFFYSSSAPILYWLDLLTLFPVSWALLFMNFFSIKSTYPWIVSCVIVVRFHLLCQSVGQSCKVDRKQVAVLWMKTPNLSDHA